MTKEERKRLLTPDQVASKLGVSSRTVRRWLREKKLKGLRAGRQWLVAPKALETFLHGGDERELTLRIDAGIGVLRVEDNRTGDVVVMPDEFWDEFATLIEERGLEDTARVVREALKKFQAYKSSLSHLAETQKK